MKFFYNLFSKCLMLFDRACVARGDSFATSIGENYYQQIYMKYINHYIDNANDDNPLNILDAGCGTGRILLELVRKGHKCVGVDFHGPTVAILREKAAECALDLEVIQGEIQKCLKDFHAGSFDVVLCLEVLMRCPDYREILGSFHRILKPGGLLMATFRSRFYLITTLLRQGKFAAAHQVVQQSEGLVRYARIPCYMNWHSLREIGELLAAGGFESLETVPIGRFSGTHYDGMAALVDVDQLIDEESRKALEFLECATIEDLGGIGRFLLAIARKAGGPVAVA